MELVNLTPHDVHVVCADGSIKTFPRSGTVARCEEVRELVTNVGGIDVYRVTYGNVYDLPGEWDGANPFSPETSTGYIVSMPVKLALPRRHDLFSPGELIRNEAGQPIGCKGLACNM